MALKTFFINSTEADYGEEEFNYLQKFLLDQGVLHTQGADWADFVDLEVAENDTPDMNIKVAKGNAVIETERNSVTFKVFVFNNAIETLAVGANTSGVDRVDAVVLKLSRTTEPNSLMNNVANLEVVAGTGASAMSDADIQTALGADYDFIRLANITVADSATTITDADIGDTRERVLTTDAIQYSPTVLKFKVVTSDPASPAEGEVWYNSTDNKMRYYDGTAVINIEASTFTGGDGIDITSSIITIDLATNSGLEISGGKLKLGREFIIQSLLSINEALEQTEEFNNIDQLSYDNTSITLTEPSSQTRGVAFSNDGTKAYVLAYSAYIYQYTCSTPYDITTATYDSKSLDLTGQMSNPYDIQVKPDGTRIFVLGINQDAIFQYDLSTAWDISSGSHVSTQWTFPESHVAGFQISLDGTKIIILDKYTYEYLHSTTLSTPWEITSVGTWSGEQVHELSDPSNIVVSPDGKKVFALSQTDEKIYQYNLSTAWNASTISYSGLSFSIGRVTKAIGSNMEKKFYLCGKTDKTIYQYTLPFIINNYYSFILPEEYTGKDIKDFIVAVINAGSGSSGSTTFQLQKRSISGSTAGTWTDILSTEAEIEAGEYDSRDATTQPVIDINKDNISSKEQYRVKVTGLSASDIKGLNAIIKVL